MAKYIVRKLSFLICKSYKYSIVFRTFAKENQHKNISYIPKILPVIS